MPVWAEDDDEEEEEQPISKKIETPFTENRGLLFETEDRGL